MKYSNYTTTPLQNASKNSAEEIKEDEEEGINLALPV